VNPIIGTHIYTAEETAELLRISGRHLRKLVARGEVKPVTYASGKHLFLGEELLRLVRSTND
jgi:predicted site-specific integrase-resolvase